MIHPDDLIALGIDSESSVSIGNNLGEVALHCKAFDGVQPGVVIVESIWPSSSFLNGVGINTLVSADIAPPAGGAVYHDTAVWIRPYKT